MSEPLTAYVREYKFEHGKPLVLIHSGEIPASGGTNTDVSAHIQGGPSNRISLVKEGIVENKKRGIDTVAEVISAFVTELRMYPGHAQSTVIVRLVQPNY